MVRSTTSALLVACLLAACGPEAEAPFRVQVIDYVGFDRATEEPVFELVERELTQVTSFERLDGPWLRMFRGGTLEIREIAGSLVSDGSFDGGDEPGLRYEVDAGVVIAKDYPTLAMLSSYYQFERVFSSMERITGEDADTFVARVGKYEVLFEPILQADLEDGAGTASLKFNAFFLPGGARQFGLARRSALERVPLAADSGVVSHEFGHALFEATFHDDSPTCDSATGPQTLDERLTSEYALAGLNEGFADFIAFSALGTTNVLGSYEFTGDDRSLTRSAFDFRGIGSECVSFYCLGTLFARSLYDAYVSLGNDPDDEDARGAFSREIVMALAATQETMAARDELPPADPAASECDLRLEISSSYDAQVTAAFLAAFLDNLTGEIQAQVCDAAASNFGSAFPANAGVCP